MIRKTVSMAVLRILMCCALMLALDLAGAQDFAAVPPLKARVTDTIGMLRPEQRAALENVLREYEERTGSQIVVLLVGSTAPEAIEQYGIRVAEEWKIGRKGVDDGVILIVARDNPPALRRLRIEAGRGVQGTLTDAQSKRILQDVIAPHFRQNDFYGGLAAGVSAISSLLDKEKFPAPRQQTEPARAEDIGSLLPFLFILFVLLSIMMSRSRSRNRLSSDGWGRNAGIILGSGLGNAMGRGGYGGGYGGGFGGSGGGGFSGGGGTFDGGGASGDW
jgi:uncharacterized protein